MALALSTRSKEVLTGLAVPVLGLFLLSAGELTLRIVQYSKFGTVETVEKSDVFYVDDETGLRIPRPGADMGVFKINSHGFRGPELSIEKSSSTLRIAFLGSSTTFDGGIAENSTWAAQTVSRVAQAVPSGCAVEYLNAGLPAFGTDQMQAYFSAHIRRFNPDITVILPGDITNDNNQDLRARGYDHRKIIASSWLGQRSLLWGKIEKNLLVISLQRKARRGEGFVDFDEQRHAAAFGKRLQDLVSTVQDSGSVPVLVTVTGRIRDEQDAEVKLQAGMTALLYNPFTSIEDLLAARRAYNERVTDVAQKSGALLVGDELAIPADQQHFKDSMHFTPQGSAVQGKRVSSAIIAMPKFADTVKAAGGACAEK